MKKIALFLGLMAIICMNVKAQNKMELRFGLFGGVNLANMQLDDAFAFDGTLWNHNLYDLEKEMHVGLRVGGIFEMKFSQTFSFQTELFYNQTGFKQEYKYFDTAGEWECEAKTSVHALSVGVIAKIWPTKWMSVDLGVQPNINLSVIKKTEKEIGKVKEYEGFSYLPEGYSAFAFDALAGLTFYPWRKLFIQARYNLGFTNVLKADTPYYDYIDEDHTQTKLYHSFSDATSKNRTFQLSVGFLF